MSSLTTSPRSSSHLPSSQQLSHTPFPSTTSNILPGTFSSLTSSESCFSSKRSRAHLGSTWDDIPALVNLIVALAVDDAEQTAEVVESPSEVGNHVLIKNRNKKHRSEQLDLTETDIQGGPEPP